MCSHHKHLQKENVLYRLWEEEAAKKRRLRTTCGQAVEIFSAGYRNHHAGPDYFNALVKINGLTWAGNIEIHLCSSMWVKHRHHLNPAYNNVILHVVSRDDAPALSSGGRRIPALLLKTPDPDMEDAGREDLTSLQILCSQDLKYIQEPVLQKCLKLMAAERKRELRQRIEIHCRTKENNWGNILYQILASGFGIQINTLPFEMLARGLPYRLLLEWRDHLPALEALMFGKAGFLEGSGEMGAYQKNLKNLFMTLNKHHSIPPMHASLWKFLRLRPASFPTLRIAQFAGLVHTQFPLLSGLLKCSSTDEISLLLRISASEYWDGHYRFGVNSPLTNKTTGKHFRETLMINALAPYLVAYGRHMKQKQALEQGFALFRELGPESNHIIRAWANAGVFPRDAGESQALIQLYTKYCKQKRCIDCLIGRELHLRTSK